MTLCGQIITAIIVTLLIILFVAGVKRWNL